MLLTVTILLRTENLTWIRGPQMEHRKCLLKYVMDYTEPCLCKPLCQSALVYFPLKLSSALQMSHFAPGHSNIQTLKHQDHSNNQTIQTPWSKDSGVHISQSSLWTLHKSHLSIAKDIISRRSKSEVNIVDNPNVRIIKFVPGSDMGVGNVVSSKITRGKTPVIMNCSLKLV